MHIEGKSLNKNLFYLSQSNHMAKYEHALLSALLSQIKIMFSFFDFLELHLQHMEVPRLRVKLEL